MLLTHDQRFFTAILRETGAMRQSQVLTLMRLYDPGKGQVHCDAMLRHLRYAGELVLTGDGMVCLPELRDRAVDREMLLALDILLALAKSPPLQITSRREPYKLCFLLERESGRIDAFAVLPVAPGREQVLSILLAQQSQDVTILLAVSSLEQHKLLSIHQKHYFVLEQGGQLRFFKGGGAGR